MSQLGDLENAIVAQLAKAEIGGTTAFEVIRGISGGWRAAVRDALHRERMPAALVGFTEEPTAPETRPALRGPRFVVLVAERLLRQGTDPRHGDAGSPGAFALLDAARAVLDGFEPEHDVRLENLHVKFIDADERTAVYELLYRAWPIIEEKRAPAAPESLQAFPDVARRAVTLTWKPPRESDSASVPAYYRLYRKTPSDSQFILIDAAAGGETARTLPTQPAGVALQFHVTAANEGGESPPGNAVVVLF